MIFKPLAARPIERSPSRKWLFFSIQNHACAASAAGQKRSDNQ
jgi:hypothetical protein